MTTQAQNAPAVGAGFVEATASSNGSTIRYFRAGEGDPLVVLHGAGGPRFSRVLDALARHWQVLLLEMPGFGAEPHETSSTIDEYADAVAESIAAIGVERYHLLGTSFGGAVAIRVALAHPDRLISLVLEAPAAFRNGATMPNEGTPADQLRRFRVHPEREPAFLPPDPAYMARTWPLVDRLLGQRPADDPELADRLPGLQVKTLVLFGDRDGIIPPENGQTWRRLLPNAALLYVHDAAHDLQGDRAEAVIDVVDDWLTRGWLFLLPQDDTLINP